MPTEQIHPEAPPQRIAGAGLGMRRSFAEKLGEIPEGAVDFLEFAPENWLDVGGRWARMLRSHTERFPCIAHGLSLSVGGPEPLDMDLLGRIARFLDEHQIAIYSEHLSYTADHAQLYELMPIPFTPEAAAHVSERIARVQDFLGRRLAVEHISYYLAPGAQMSETEFVLEVLERADCDLLLDVNNLHCNAFNHGGDPMELPRAVPPQRVAYLHLAGHRLEEDGGTIIDTHGAPVSDAVWELLRQVYQLLGPVPTLLERDYNFPPLPELLGELNQVRQLQDLASEPRQSARA